MLIFHNDGKGNAQSYEVRYKADDNYTIIDNTSISELDLEGITGYGRTLPEALDNFKQGLQFVTDAIVIKSEELNTYSPQDVKEVDCFGNITGKRQQMREIKQPLDKPIPDINLSVIEKKRKLIDIDMLLNEMRDLGADSMSIDINFIDEGKIYSISLWLNEEGSEAADE